MSKADAHESAILNLYLNGIADANLADNAASGPLGNLYLALHTADPGDAGSQTTSEAAYGAYARVAIARSSGSPAWTVASGTASNAGVVSWPTCTSGSSACTHWSIGIASSGAGRILWSGALTAPFTVTTNATPSAAIGALTIAEG